MSLRLCVKYAILTQMRYDCGDIGCKKENFVRMSVEDFAMSKILCIFARILYRKDYSMFKLLALRVLDGCGKHIQKCLKKDVYYYFCSDFRFEEYGKVYRGSKYSKPLPEDFFSAPSQEPIPLNEETFTTIINVNAIVGKNGDGKSTIVELMIRMVNNYVAALQDSPDGKFKDGRMLLYVEEVAAELYFQVDDGIYRLKITDESQTFKKLATITNDLSFDVQEEEAPFDVFSSIYTLVSNYSHYAYNIYDFDREWRMEMPTQTEEEKNEACWLFHIFHKNDGYVTPISLHPYKKSGNLDVNKEARLSKQRLLYLFLNSEDKNNSFRNILEDKTAVGIHLRPTSYSKFHQRCVIEHFKAYEKEDTSLDNVINYLSALDEDIEQDPNRTETEFKALRDKYLIGVNRALRYILEGEGCKENYPGQYQDYIESAWQWVNTNYISHPEYLRDSTNMSNIASYFSVVNSIRDKVQKTDLVQYLPDGKFEQRHKHYTHFNIRQLARLRTIYDVAMELEFDTRLCFSTKTLSTADRCRLYMIYKAISIFHTYPKYQDVSAKYSDKNRDVYIEYSRKIIKILLELLRQDGDNESHIARKYNQAKNYIEEYQKNGNEDIYRTMAKVDESTPKEGPVNVSLNTIQAYYGGEGISLENLPPAIFDTEIIFQTDNSRIDMSALSSGEKQLLNTIGAIIYHLQNIESNATYKSVNLILEEIELYFHPEYQRKFVLRLIKQIHGIGLEHVKNINMTFVTHSPFILSDVPKCNVLFLEDGNPDYRMQENTFGANIHSLLKNGFFLPNLPMGEFAHLRIDRLFRQLNSGEYDKSEENIEKIRQEIAVIGEPYLREQLYRLLRTR